MTWSQFKWGIGFACLLLEMTVSALPVLITSSERDLNGDGETDSISLWMSEGRHYLDDDLWEGRGEKFEGLFDLIVELSGLPPVTNAINGYFHPRLPDEHMFFIASPWELQFADYNKDGELDFNIGHYWSGVNYDCRLFTVGDEGEVSELIVEEPFRGLTMADRSHSSSEIQLTGGGIKTVDYSRDLGSSVTNIYDWSTGQQTFSLRADETRTDLEQADYYCESRYQERARPYYQKAAEQGNARAHFALAYKYITTPEEAIYHYSAAARLGHSQALDYALDLMLFRANSLKLADPKGALELYYAAKKANPELELYGEAGKLKTLKRCAAAPDFDAEDFVKTYGIDDEELKEIYSVWKLAEEASRGGRFGKPNPELVFQLVIRGGMVPMEFEYAVKECYSNWKWRRKKEFRIDDYVTSGMGMGWCAARENRQFEVEFWNKIRTMGQNQPYLKHLIDAAEAAAGFIEIKTEREEGHGGSGWVAWVLHSQREQKEAFVELVNSVIDGWEPESGCNRDELVIALQNVAKAIHDAEGDYLEYPEVDDVEAVQQQWLVYKNAACDLFHRINPVISRLEWECWMNKERIKQLNAVEEMMTY